ncbi:uncharacterized protein A4U43_C07F15490 [Asparagus officinalis]|uniref:Uncharacterized protein n=1 Tax=Asparagus officinalis TaxID=4686 RepID=A0A5P1EFI8_ASPOF|nr:uncharacterized protein LOC109850866 [Asparagus officinalis]ONK63471.1 uncharacterized protein A4U43_C07F15490 [Asparagus officinalis]
MEMVFGNKKFEGKGSSNQKKQRRGSTKHYGGGSSFGRPPLSPGAWHPTVPQWEKKFCTYVCSIPWKKLCETKKLMYMYPKIVEWNDSEGEEAFHNAKARYWASINYLPCPVPLPDPDKYTDIVDYNAAVDPELIEDLYKQPPVSEDSEGEKGILWDSFLFTTDTVPVTGWGDEEDQDRTVYATDHSIQIQPTGWGDDDASPTTYNNDQSIKIRPTGWDVIENPPNEESPKDNPADYLCGMNYSWHQDSSKARSGWEWQKSVS